MQMQPTEVERMFLQYRPMARHIAGRFARRKDLPFEEMVDEAESGLGFRLAMYGDEYLTSPSCSESSFCYRSIYWMLQQSRRYEHHIPFSTVQEEVKEEWEHKPGWLTTFLRGLGDEARELVNIVIQAPQEIAADVTTATRARGRHAIRNYLRDVMGWPEEKIDRAWAEVRSCLDG
jgi:hypothetical protein